MVYLMDQVVLAFQGCVRLLDGKLILRSSHNLQKLRLQARCLDQSELCQTLSEALFLSIPSMTTFVYNNNTKSQVL